MPVPDWLRIILTILSLVSFLPQIHRIIANNSSLDISLSYILLNTISTTEQFTLGFFYIASHGHDSDFFVSDPRNLGDWLNLSQLTVVWLMSLVLFTTCLFYAPSDAPKARVLTIYVSFLGISLVPLLIDALILNHGEDEYEIWFGALFFGIHSLVISPLVTLGGIASLCFQWRKASALSSAGLAAQAIVFAAVALSWTARIRFIELEGGGGSFPFKIWYELVGWAAVDNGVFALVQALLLYLAKQQQTGVRGEEEPLLGH